MKFIDTHIHLDFYNNINSIVEEINETDSVVVFMTYIPEIYEKYVNQIDNFNNIYLALGYHPSMINEFELNKKLFKKYLDKSIFIGEVGLDYSVHKNERDRIKQREVFRYITSISSEKILSVHSRNAERDVFDILVENNIKKAIFHWYTGNIKLISEIVDRGYYLSVNPSMLNSKNGVRILEEIPLDNLLIETDGPFTKWNNKIVRVNDLEEIYSEFSEFYSISSNKLFEQINHNFNRLITQEVNCRNELICI